MLYRYDFWPHATAMACFFFFQAEDGIRYWSVTGVQLCAFFFSSRRRHTRLVSDWSSDVCSSDLTPHACAEIARCLGAGMVGIKLAASRRATDPLLDPICELARERGVPVLHHV